MVIDECFQLGYIIKPHGLKGDVLVFLDVDVPENYENLESVLVRDGDQLVPFFIDSINISADKAIVKFNEVDSIDLAQNLKSSELYLPLDLLPKLPNDQFYFHEIIGFNVIDQVLGTLGKIKDVYSTSGQDLIAMNYKNAEVLIPMQDDILISVDKSKKEVEVNLPDGLLDIYIGS